MKIPIFVSCPTLLNKDQMKAREIIIKIVEELGLEPRALGRTDYPTVFPLKEVLIIARHCSGGIILGFEQFSTNSGVWKKGTEGEKRQEDYIPFSSPWNQLEAGILFGLGLPLMVFRESTITGGVFDQGVTDVFVQKMPMGKISKENKDALKDAIKNWYGEVNTHYRK
jgi:hypothetical protein